MLIVRVYQKIRILPDRNKLETADKIDSMIVERFALRSRQSVNLSTKAPDGFEGWPNCRCENGHADLVLINW